MEATPSWRPLGELIVERGLISQEDLEDALLEQRITHKRLGTILIDKGIVTAQQLTDSLVDQIGVEELLDEIDQSGNGGDADASPSGPSALRRLRPRLHIDLPAPTRITKPFSRIGPKRSPLGHRRQDGPVAPFAPLPSGQDEPEESFETAVLELADYDRGREPEPQPEPELEHEPEPEPEPAPELEAEPEAEPEPTAGPHAWLAEARRALDEAEIDVNRLDNFGIARAVELEEARARLAEEKAAAGRASEAQRRAEEEISRLHTLIDERDAGLTKMEGTVEELREIVTATQTELETSRAASAALSSQLAELQTTLKSKSAELDAATTESERRAARISELEAQAAELAENLSATDETLGIEMHAREQAQRDAKRLHEELDERDARVAKLAAQVEALEAELELVVAEREQSQRKLRSRERRVTKLESTVAELRGGEQTTSATPSEEPEAVAAVEPEAKAEPVKAAPSPAPTSDAKQVAGFLYFVPREGDGYELVEQSGSAPAVGDTIELGGKSFSVTRHSRSPLPFDRRVCVYLRAG